MRAGPVVVVVAPDGVTGGGMTTPLIGGPLGMGEAEEGNGGVTGA
jgi:hypothetical protein